MAVNKTIAIAFVVLGFALPAAGDVLSPALIVRDAKKGTYDPVKIADMKVETRIVSNMAVTTMDMTFQNDLDRVLEGQLVFPLPQGSLVSRFAMDVNGKLREGVIVEKDKGRQVFEETVRRNIDPGLLEWVSGNSFKARIYPIPAKGTKRIVVAYEEELPAGASGMVYRLPLQYKQPIGSFSIEVTVAASSAPEIKSSPFKEIGFKVEEGNQVARTHFDDMTIDGELAVSLPAPQSDCEIYLDEDGKDTYFYLVHRPEIASRDRAMPASAAVLWDASGSSASRNIALELEVLADYLARMPGAKLTLVAFRNSAEAPETFGGEGAAAKLIERIRSLPADGGTSLGCLDLAALKLDAEEYLLFTDGNSNVGGREVRNAGKPVRVFSSSPSANHPYLELLAEQSAGEYFNLAAAGKADVLRRLSTDAFRFLCADFEEGSFADVHPRLPVRVSGRFAMCGRVLKPGAELALNYGLGAKVEKTVKMKFSDLARKDPSQSVRRAWAKREISALSVFHEENAAKILALGRKFRVVTPETSLIVLDALEDYVRHDIVPPEDMQEAFWKQVESRKAAETKTREARITEVLARWAALKEWWGKEFKYPENLRLEDKEKKDAEGGAGAEEESAPGDSRPRPGAPSPTPTPTPSPAPRAAGAPGSDRGGAEDAAQEKSKGEGGSPAEGGITLKKWDPATPYLAEIRKASKDEAYGAYMKQRTAYAQSSAFFLDVADFFLDLGDKAKALRILTNIAEMELDNHQLLRILGHRLDQMGEFGLAAEVFRKVLKMRPEEPQSYRDLGLVLAKAGKNREAVDMLYRVVTGVWDDRFPEVDLIALVEMNEILSEAVKKGEKDFDVDKRFLALIEVDLRVILNWDADNCDMDLWIIEPSGEKCFYSNRNTTIGGRMSCDFTRGYGPEEYMVRKAMPGKYMIQVNYYGNTQQVLAGATTIQVLIIKNFGRENEERINITRRLKDKQEVLDIAEALFGKK